VRLDFVLHFGERRAIRLLGGDFLVHPAQVGFVAGEGLDEMCARHARAGDAECHDLALVRAHFFHRIADLFAQAVDLAHREAECHQQFGDFALGLHVLRAAEAVFGVGGLCLFIGLANEFELRQCLDFELCQVGGSHGCAGFFIVLFVVVVVVVDRVLFVGRVGGSLSDRGFGFDKAVDQFVDAQLVLFDLRCHVEDLLDGERARRNGLHHMAQTFLDALGDFDFALAGEQVDRAHFAHVHAHRIGGAAEFRIDRGQRLLGFGHHVFVCDGGGGSLHQQGFGIRRLVVDLDAHIVDHADHAFDLVGVQHLVGQVVVDFGVGQKAAFLAQDDQVLQLGATRFGLNRRQLFQGDQRFGFFGAATRFSSTYCHRYFSAQVLPTQPDRAEKNRSKTGNYTANRDFVLRRVTS